MSLSIDSLRQQGAFAAADLVEKSITFHNGTEDVTLTAFIRPLSYKTAVAELAAARVSQDALAARIAASICDKGGSPVFTVGDVTGEADPERGPLSGELTMALLSAIGEVSGLGKAKGR